MTLNNLKIMQTSTPNAMGLTHAGGGKNLFYRTFQ